MPRETPAHIVGSTNDGGLQAMVVAIGGTTDRPDGGIFHITLSLDGNRGRKAVESNTVIGAPGWQTLEAPAPLRIKPARFD